MEHRELYSVLYGELNRRKSKKEGIYIYRELIYFTVQQELTQRYKATLLQ